MLFTGSVQRRRKINLGGNSTSGFSRQSVLQRSKEEREKRELERKRQNAATIIQSSWRSVLDLRRAAKEMTDEKGGSNEQVLRRFAFVARVTKVTTAEELATIFSIVESEADVLPNQLLRNVISSAELFVNDDSLLPIVADLDATMAPFSSERAAEIIFSKANVLNLWSQSQALASYHSTLFLTKLLTRADIFSKIDWETLTLRIEQARIDQRMIGLTEDEVVTAIKNIIHLMRTRHHTGQLIAAATALVDAYAERLEQAHGYDSDDELISASDESSDVLSPLYERDVITTLLSFVDSDSVAPDDTGSKSLALLTRLMSLQPSKSSQITMALILHPKPIARLVWERLKKLLMESSPGSQSDDKATAFAEDFVKRKYDMVGLELLLHMQNFWLMVADDDEFLKNDTQGLTIDETREFITFLKNFTYNALVHDSRLKQLLPEEYSLLLKLRKASVVVLRQVFLRDMRRNFMPKGFWLSEYAGRLDKTAISKLTQDEHAQEKTPTQALMNDVPFSLTFDTRVAWFVSQLELSWKDRDRADRYARRGTVTIRRDNAFEDAYEAFYINDISIIDFYVVFVNAEGDQEAGIDGGGLTKEMLNAVSAEGFHPDNGLFVETANHLLYPNPDIVKIADPAVRAEKLNRIVFLGRLIGKSLLEGILLDYEFAPFFLQKCQGSRLKNSFDDLFWLDPELYNGLVRVLRYDGNVQEAMELTFEFDEVELVPGGSQIPVTNANRLNYIHAVANYKLNTVLGPQSNAFFSGVAKFIEPRLLSMFSAPELQTLISGESGPVNLQDFRNNIKLTRFSFADQTIKDFFEVLSEFDGAQWSRFLKFVTSVPKPPLGGFSSLHPLLCIYNAGSDTDRLPSASTCMNLLKMPDYKDKKVLKKKLLQSIDSGAGFDFS